MTLIFCKQIKILYIQLKTTKATITQETTLTTIEKADFHPSWQYQGLTQRAIIWKIKSLLVKKDLESLRENLQMAEDLLMKLHQDFSSIQDELDPELTQEQKAQVNLTKWVVLFLLVAFIAFGVSVYYNDK